MNTSQGTYPGVAVLGVGVLDRVDHWSRVRTINKPERIQSEGLSMNNVIRKGSQILSKYCQSKELEYVFLILTLQ